MDMRRGAFRSVRNYADLRRNQWYRFKNLATAGTVQLDIYDEIGYFGISADAFVQDLRKIEANRIDVHLNTPGGEVFDGIAIYNALKSHNAQVYVQVDSLAASIGSVIAMAGDRIAMAPHSQMMIHDAFGLSIGNAQDMRDLADMLDKQSNNIAGIYADRAGKDIGFWRDQMRQETMYSDQEAVDAGLADVVGTLDSFDTSNAWDLSKLSTKRPEPVANHTENGDQTPAEEFDWDPALFEAAFKAGIFGEGNA